MKIYVVAENLKNGRLIKNNVAGKIFENKKKIIEVVDFYDGFIMELRELVFEINEGNTYENHYVYLAYVNDEENETGEI